MPDERDERTLDENLARLLRRAERPELDPQQRAEMLNALKARQAELRQKQEGAMRAAGRLPRSVAYLVAAAAVAALVAGAWVALAPGRRPPTVVAPPEQPFPRPIAMQETVGKVVKQTLADGSIVIARPGAKFTVGKPRTLRLEAGDLYLIVARADEPFVVHAPQGQATATGTRFAIASSAETRVAVAQGTVTLSNDEGEVQVKAGEEGVLPSDHKPSREPAPRISYLVSWAKEALAQAKRLVEKKARDTGELIAVDPWGQEMRLTLRKYHVDVHIEDGVARTTVDQTFFNHVPWNIEGTFYFPLPPDASVSRLAMYVAGKLMEGGMVERSRGQEIYTHIKYQRRDPALLEMMEGNVFKMRIFPIEGRQEKRIFLSYTQKLDSLYGTLRYWFPMDHTHSRAREVGFRVRVKDGADLYAPHSSTHALQARKEGNDLVLTYAARDIKPDQDLLLHLVPSERAGRASFATTSKEGFRYVFARVTPHLPGKLTPRPRQWIVLNDVSASRTELDVLAQAHILERLIEEADDDDTVTLINLNTKAAIAQPRAVPVRVPAAQKLVGAAQVELPLGATNLAAGLQAADDEIQVNQADNPHILYLGDGTATDGKTTIDELLNRLPQGATFVGVGVGKKADANALQALADATGGIFALINPDEDIDWRVFDLVATLNTPRLLGLTAQFESADGEPADILAYPSARALADGETLVVAGRTKGELPSSLLIRGSLGGEPFVRRYALAGARADGEFIPRLWAKRHIDELLKSGEEHKAEIVRLAKQYYVMTPYSSLIVLENEKMYEEFNVERGRKDHWALYPAPPTIPVVKEPVDWSRWSWWGYQSEDDKVKAKADPSTVKDIVESVQFRINAPFYYWRPQRWGRERFALYRLLDVQGDPTRLLTGLFVLAARKPGEAEPGEPGEPLPPAREPHSVPPPGLATEPGPPAPPPVSAHVAAGEFLPPVLSRYRLSARYYFRRLDPILYGSQLPVRLQVAEGKSLDVAKLFVPAGLFANGKDAFANGYLSFGFYEVDDPAAIPLLGSVAGATWTMGTYNKYDFEQLPALLVDGRSHGLGLELNGRFLSERLGADEDLATTAAGWLSSAAFEQGKLAPATWLGTGMPLTGAVGDTGRVLAPQLQFALGQAVTERWGRIERDITEFNRRYGGYWNGWGWDYSGGWNRLDLRKSYSLGRYGGLREFLGDDEEGEARRGLALEHQVERGTRLQRRIAPSVAVAVYGQAAQTVPGTASALAGDYLASRRDALREKALTADGAKELAQIEAALKSLEAAYPQVESTGLFWSHQGWHYRPQPWAFQEPQIQVYPWHNWSHDLTRYCSGLYSTTFDVMNAVAEAFPLAPQGKVSAEAARCIEAARQAIRPVRMRFGKDEPPRTPGVRVLVGPGDRFAFTHTTDMELEERLVCDGQAVYHLYPELGLAARRPATPLRLAALRVVAPHLLEPADWLARRYNVEFAGEVVRTFLVQFTLKLEPIMPAKEGEEPAEPPYHILVTVSPDGRILEKTLVVKGETRLKLAYACEGSTVTAKWFDGEGKELASASFEAEPFTPEADTFAVDTQPYVVFDMPLRRPSYYEAQLQKAKDAAQRLRELPELPLIKIDLSEQVRLGRHLALAHIQELNWRRWGGHNPQAYKALDEMRKTLGQAGQKPKLGDLTLAGAARRLGNATEWAKEAGLPDTHPVVSYLAQVQSNWRKMASIRDRSPKGLVGHLAAYHAAMADAYDNKAEAPDLDRFLKDHDRSPLLFAAVHTRVQHGNRPTTWFRLFDHPTWRFLAITMATVRHGSMSVSDQERVAQAFAGLYHELAEKGVELPLTPQTAALLRSAEGGKHWQSVVRTALKLATDSDRAGDLLRFAELALANGEPELAHVAISRVRKEAGDSLLAKLALAQTYWAANQPKEALRLYDEVLAALEAKGIPPSAALLAATARLAQQAGDPGRAIELEERALAMEHPHLPDLVNLQAFRQRYRWLWNQYVAKVQEAANAKDAKALADWMARAERTWPRWYEVDRENVTTVHLMADIQHIAGRGDDVWLYLSSLIDAKPKDAQSHFSVGEWYRVHNDLDQAQQWYARAYEWDTANPQWLFKRATTLRDMGRKADARRVFRQIIDGKWAPGLERWADRARKEIEK